MAYLLKGGIVLGRPGVPPSQADILVVGDRIGAVGPQLAPEPGDDTTEVIDLAGKAVIPGLINAHTHSYANLVRGMGARLPLEPWMYFAMLVGRFSKDELRLAALLQVLESVKHGTTGFVDHLAREYEGLDCAMSTYAETGVRAYVAPMISDRRYDQALPVTDGDLTADEIESFAGTKPRPAGDLLAECEQLIRKWHARNGLLGVMVGPSGPQRCSDELLVGAAELSERLGVGFHTHLLETRIQAETGRRLYGKSMVEHLRDIGILSERVSLAHAVWVDEREIELIAESGASVVHNPLSNLSLGSGIAPVPAFLRSGVNVALGTDGSNCGGNQSVWESMRLAAVLPRAGDREYRNWPSSSDALAMATAGGARVLRLDAGEISVGKLADLVIVDISGTAYQPVNDIVEQMVLGETGRGVESVMVAGRFVLRDGTPLTIDEDTVLAEARKAAGSIAAKKTEWFSRVRLQYDAVERLYRRHNRLE